MDLSFQSLDVRTVYYCQQLVFQCKKRSVRLFVDDIGEYLRSSTGIWPPLINGAAVVMREARTPDPFPKYETRTVRPVDDDRGLFIKW